MATNPWTSQTISGFNSSPPADDGSAVVANQLFWSTIKTKLADPIKTLAESINSALTTMGGKLINIGADESNAMAGSLAFTSSELTIAAGVVTATRSHHTIDTQSDAATDDLDTINTGSVADGCLLVIRAANASREVVVKHGTGNIFLFDSADFSLNDVNKSVTLQRRGTDWFEITRSFYPITGYLYSSSAATTSGSSVSFTGIPADVSEIFLTFTGVKQDTANQIPTLQIGDSGGLENSGYTGVLTALKTATAATTRSANSTSFGLTDNEGFDATESMDGSVTLRHLGSNAWSISGNLSVETSLYFFVPSGVKTLSGTLTQLTIALSVGTPAFTAGTIYINAK